MQGSGVTHYTWLAVEIPFPNGEVRCDHCPLLETYARKQCRRTGEYLADTRMVGGMCPLVEIKEKEEN